MRIRSIKPEFWRSTDISQLPIEDRLLYIGLWSYVDDNGVGPDRLSLITADLFPDDLERESRETLARVQRGLDALSNAGLIHRYREDRQPLLYVVKWDRHQRIDRPSKPRFPRPETVPTRGYEETQETLDEYSTSSPRLLASGAGEQGAGEQGSGSSVVPHKRTATKRGTRLPDEWIPTQELIAQMHAECPTIDLKAEHLKFTDYWHAKTGRDATKLDWNATWRNWIRNAKPSNGTKPRNQQETEAWLTRAMERAIAADEADMKELET